MPIEEPWMVSLRKKQAAIKKKIGAIANPVKRNAMYADKRNWGKE